MGKRRGNFEGSVRERPDGRYEARLSYVDPETGGRKRASVYAASRKLAMDKLYEVRDRIEAGAPPRDATRTVAVAVDNSTGPRQHDTAQHTHVHTGSVGVRGSKPLSSTMLERLRVFVARV